MRRCLLPGWRSQTGIFIGLRYVFEMLIGSSIGKEGRNAISSVKAGIRHESQACRGCHVAFRQTRCREARKANSEG